MRYKNFDEAMEAFDKRVSQACIEAGHRKCVVEYSNYVYADDVEEDEDDPIVDNLDQVAVEGKVIFYAEADEDGKDYRSDVVENPTWLEVCVFANAMILKTKDYHHCYLEGISRSVPVAVFHQPNVTAYRFDMGS